METGEALEALKPAEIESLYLLFEDTAQARVCDDCETLIQAPVPAQVIDKGIPTAGLLAHVMIAKFADHLPLYRQESIFGRAGLAIQRSTLAQWVGVTGVQLQPLVDALRDVVLGQQVSMLMKHRCRCSLRARRKLTALMCGPTGVERA